MNLTLQREQPLGIFKCAQYELARRARGLVGQVVLQAHLRDLIPLALVPIDVILFHLENLNQQIGRALIVHFARQADASKEELFNTLLS